MVDILGDLARLQKLREAGVLNEDEFQEQKSRVLAQGQSADIGETRKFSRTTLEDKSEFQEPLSSFTPVDLATIGVFIVGLAMFWILGLGGIFLYAKFFLVLSIISAIIIYIDARYIDLQGYDWNRAKWGFTTIPLSLIIIPIYILKRDRFLEEISQKYAENVLVLIKKSHLLLLYGILCIALIYDMNTGDTGQSPEDLGNASAESIDASPVPEPNQTQPSNEFTAAEQPLIDKWAEANELCRGSSDAEIVAQWCPIRDRAIAELNDIGICYGRESDASAAGNDIHRCRQGSYRDDDSGTSLASETSNAESGETVWDCSYLYGEEILVTLDARTYKFSPNNPNGGQSSGILTKGRAERHPYSGTMDTPLTLKGSKSGEWALVDGSEGIALLHYAEGSGDGSECTLPGQGPKYASNAN